MRSALYPIVAWSIGVLCTLYLLNVGGGQTNELIDDSLPGFGNLDEFLAAVLLMAALRYFGMTKRLLLPEPNVDEAADNSSGDPEHPADD